MKFKVCGMKYPDNMGEVAALGPDYLGFIFWEHSPRFFEGTIPSLPAGIKKVGVFVDATLQSVLNKVQLHSLDLIQLHGKETPEYCAELKAKFVDSSENNTLKIIKAISVGKTFNFDILEEYQQHVDYFLFDSKGPLPGGNGFAFDWKLLKDYTLETPFFLSGGIGMSELGNLKDFLATGLADRCHAIDVNSAFESSPGLKRTAVLDTFLNTLKRLG